MTKHFWSLSLEQILPSTTKGNTRETGSKISKFVLRNSFYLNSQTMRFLPRPQLLAVRKATREEQKSSKRAMQVIKKQIIGVS